MFFKKKKPTVYKYFISYVVLDPSGKGTLFNTDIHLVNKIKSIQDIWKIENYLQEYYKYKDGKSGTVTISSYHLLDKNPDFVPTFKSPYEEVEESSFYDMEYDRWFNNNEGTEICNQPKYPKPPKPGDK